MRYGYVGGKNLESLIKQGLLKSAKTCILEFYEHYVLRKHTRVKFDTVIHNIEGIFLLCSL